MSREFYIVYNPETGDELMRGSGPAGVAAQQQPAIGRALKLPREAMLGKLSDNLALVKAAMIADLDERAEELGPLVGRRTAISTAPDLATLLRIDTQAGAAGA